MSSTPLPTVKPSPAESYHSEAILAAALLEGWLVNQKSMPSTCGWIAVAKDIRNYARSLRDNRRVS